MIDEGRPGKWTLGGGFSASVLVHAAVLALLVFGLPALSLPEPPPVEAVQVELVPPEADAAEQAEETPAEQPAPPPPEAQPEPPPQQQAQAEPPPAADAQDAMPVLDPVVRYGDEDAGQEAPPDGDSAEQAREPAPEPAQASQEPVESGAPALPEVLASRTIGGVSVHLAKPQDRPDAPAETTPSADAPALLEEAKTLFSPAVTNDPVATTAMRNLPRGVRAGKLCVTELREQLLRASPPYRPDILPQHEPSGNSVMVVPLTAFRADLQWYDLSFRCAVDAEATRVVSFAFRVGAPIPRAEWRQRGLPAR
ncbi:MAG: DUF930 domain-containing protein [Rhizobiaceae bacterium]